MELTPAIEKKVKELKVEFFKIETFYGNPILNFLRQSSYKRNLVLTKPK